MGAARRWAAVLGLSLLSPFCAEYLIGYQGPLTGPVEALAGMVVLAPLYGTAAVLVRELARRAGRGWPTMLLLSAGFGLVQAGLVDQSLFNHGFTGEAYWQALPTLVPGVDVDASQLVTFVGGHVVWSFGAPIAVVEAASPRLADRPWLGWPAPVLVGLVYAAGAVVFWTELGVRPGFHAHPARLAGTALVVAALGVAAFLLPRRRSCRLRRAPHPLVVAGAVLPLLAVDVLVNGVYGWLGVAAAVLALCCCGGLLLRWSGRAGWGPRHVLAASGAALVLYAVVSFAVDPLGASYAVKYTSSAVVLACVLALLAWAWWRSRARRDRTPAAARS